MLTLLRLKENWPISIFPKFKYSDNPGIVIGFHGCDSTIADDVLKNGKSLNPSQNSYDWLGSGIYFWETDKNRALEWAKKNHNFKNPSVIGAFIQLGNCLNLLNAEHIQLVEINYEILKNELKILALPLPKNRKAHKHDHFNLIRELDCRVIMRLHQYIR